MSYGFLARNNSGEVLISDVMKNLHLKEKITTPTSISVPYTTFGGLSKFTYQFTCSSTPVPFFTMPFTDRFYCMTGAKNVSGNTWQVEILSSGGFPNAGATGSTQGSATTTTNTREPSSGTFFNNSSNTIRFSGGTMPNIFATSGYASTEYYGVLSIGSGSIPMSFSGNDGIYSIIWNGTSVISNQTFSYNTSTFAFTSSPNLSANGYTYTILDTSNNGLVDVSSSSTADFGRFVPGTNPGNSALFVRQYRIFRVQNQVTSTTGSSGNNPTGSYTDAQTPNLYVFADPTAISASGSYGFQVKNSNGDVSFDSRMRPLQIHSTVNITHPLNASNALASGLSARNCSSNHSSNFLPNVTSDHVTSTQPTEPMFFFSSLSQRHHEHSITEIETECDGVEVKGNCIGVERDYHWRSTYWAFYRCALKRDSATNLRAGWITKEHACYHSRSLNSSFFGIDGLSPDSSAQGDGKHPWNDANINNAQNTCIIADSGLYN